jgi:phage baseplate assembly protein V
MIREIDARIRRHLSGIRQAFRGVLTLVKAAGAVQLVQADGLAGESLQDNELFQHYGYTSNPPAGTMAIVLPIGGKTAHGIIVATEHGSYRLKNLASGEVAIYTDEGDSIILKRGRLIEATTQTFRLNTQIMEVNASTKIDFNTPMVTCSEQATVQHRLTGNGSLSITNTSGTGGTSSFVGPINQTGGSYTTDTDVVANGISVHGHHHNGVQPGSGNTGTPM